MRLARIEIENFKGIGNRQVVDLKPITLLFGPNSAGKSTILQSLHYLREILERGNADPDQTIAGGLIDLGGFAALVHGHDLNREIKLKVCIDLGDDQGSERLPLNSGGSLRDPDFASLGLRYLLGEYAESKENAFVKSIALGLEVQWSELIAGPFISRLTVDLNGQQVAEILSPAQPGRARLCKFQFDHPLLVDSAQSELLELSDEDDGEEPDLDTQLKREIAELSRDMASIDLSSTQIRKTGQKIPKAIRAQLVQELASYKQARFTDIHDGSELNEQDSVYAIAVDTRLGALPDLDTPLKLDLRDVEPEDVQAASDDLPEFLRTPGMGKTRRAIDIELGRRKALSDLLDELVLGPARIVRDYLNAMTYIGPLREIPGRRYRPRRSPDESRWAQGLAAWDLLYSDTAGKLLEEVNAWLGGEERLKTGYRLEKFQFREVPVPSRFHQLFDRGLSEDDLGELQELYATLGGRSEIALRDFEKGIIVAPSDVGVGISQMIPVIVSCLRNQQGILAIEQPELHVHPAIQVGLGDLFIHAVQPSESVIGAGKTLLVETHSEHIMLRLLRRIREVTENEVPPGVIGLSPNDLSVIYVESCDDGVRFRPLRVDREGEFIDRWPKGFFEERAEELF